MVKLCNVSSIWELALIWTVLIDFFPLLLFVKLIQYGGPQYTKHWGIFTLLCAIFKLLYILCYINVIQMWLLQSTTQMYVRGKHNFIERGAAGKASVV